MNSASSMRWGGSTVGGGSRPQRQDQHRELQDPWPGQLPRHFARATLMDFGAAAAYAVIATRPPALASESQQYASATDAARLQDPKGGSQTSKGRGSSRESLWRTMNDRSSCIADTAGTGDWPSGGNGQSGSTAAGECGTVNKCQHPRPSTRLILMTAWSCPSEESGPPINTVSSAATLASLVEP